jgi:hypothetical protein
VLCCWQSEMGQCTRHRVNSQSSAKMAISSLLTISQNSKNRFDYRQRFLNHLFPDRKNAKSVFQILTYPISF